jgi:hypothetical protein
MTMELSLEMKASVAPDVLVQETLDESVLLNIRTGQYFGLNAVGSRMWTTLTTSSSLRAACEALKDEYDIEAERLEHDVLSLVGKLTEAGLLEVRGG